MDDERGASSASEFARFERHFPGWVCDGKDSGRARPMQFHAGNETQAKRDILAALWALEFDEAERALMSRMRPHDVAVLAFRYPLVCSGILLGGEAASLDDPMARNARRAARAALCARRACGRESMFGAPWIDSPAFDDFWRGLPGQSQGVAWGGPPDPRLAQGGAAVFMAAALGSGAPLIGLGALALMVGASRLAWSACEGAMEMRARSACREALEKAYPEQAAQGVFDEVDRRRWVGRAWPFDFPSESCQQATEPARQHWWDSRELSAEEKLAGERLLARLSEGGREASWLEERARSLREGAQIEQAARPGSPHRKPARL